MQATTITTLPGQLAAHLESIPDAEARAIEAARLLDILAESLDRQYADQCNNAAEDIRGIAQIEQERAHESALDDCHIPLSANFPNEPEDMELVMKRHRRLAYRMCAEPEEFDLVTRRQAA